jgi:hypothetical protein
MERRQKRFPFRSPPDGLAILFSLFLSVACLPVYANAQVVHSLNSTTEDFFDCTGISGNLTHLAGNSAALDLLRSWCAADVHCAQLYGQTGAPKFDAFAHLFQTSLTQPVGDVSMEDPLHDLLCNKTTEEFLQTAWVLILKNQLLSASPCDVNEQPILRADGTGIDCICQPGKNCDSTTGSMILTIVFIVIIAVAAVTKCAPVIWTRHRLLAANRIRERQKRLSKPTMTPAGSRIMRRFPASTVTASPTTVSRHSTTHSDLHIP